MEIEKIDMAWHKYLGLLPGGGFFSDIRCYAKTLELLPTTHLPLAQGSHTALYVSWSLTDARFLGPDFGDHGMQTNVLTDMYILIHLKNSTQK